jgi:hypothetical protein
LYLVSRAEMAFRIHSPEHADWVRRTGFLLPSVSGFVRSLPLVFRSAVSDRSRCDGAANKCPSK